MESGKSTARIMQVRKVHREANRLAMEGSMQRQGVIDKMELKQQVRLLCLVRIDSAP